MICRETLLHNDTFNVVKLIVGIYAQDGWSLYITGPHHEKYWATTTIPRNVSVTRAADAWNLLSPLAITLAAVPPCVPSCRLHSDRHLLLSSYRSRSLSHQKYHSF